MLKLSTKSLVFMFSTVFLLLPVAFYFKSDFAKNISVKFAEIFSQSGFLTASLSETLVSEQPEEVRPPEKLNESSVEVGPLSVLAENQQKQIDLSPHQLTQEEIQEELDDIAEKVDLIKQQVADLVDSSKPKKNQANLEEELKENKANEDEKNDQQDRIKENEKLPEKPSKNIAVGGGGKPNYLKILISEIQIAGVGGEKQEFVELYNPNDGQVDLTDWYLQKKTKSGADYSTFASNNLFFGKKIAAMGYFVIARQDFLTEIADIAIDYSLSEDNSLILKNPNREVSDKVGWGEASDYESSPIINPKTGQTIGRKLILDEEQDTDNNLSDFEIQLSTPKSKNIIFIEPPPPVPKEPLKNILISEIQIEPISQRFVELYNPNSVEVNLTGWYLQRKDANDDSWGSFISSPKFQSKTIPANGYFLISRQIENSDILSDITLSEDNSLVLKNPNGEISDKLGFGNAKEFETSPAQFFLENQSIGRKFDNVAQNYLDADNNSADFELDTPSPKEKNIKYVEPPKDVTPPTVVFALSPTQNSLNFTINFTIIDLLGTVTPSGAGSYIFHWKEENAKWQEDSSQNFFENPVKRDFIGQDQKTYYFQIKAKDLVGNESVWLPAESVFTKIEIPKPVEILDIPSIITYTISNLIISPNNDGIEDTADIDWKFSEEVKVNVDIINSDGIVIFKNFYESDKVTNPRIKTWDGKDVLSAVVPDGIYTIKVVITNSAGNSIADTNKTITIKNI